MDKKTERVKNILLHEVKQLTVKEKIIWILQVLFPIAIIITAVLGLTDIVSIQMSNTIDLILLMLLFIICGVKLLPKRIMYAIIYFVVAALMCAIMVTSFINTH